jgi:hypothetical protein
LSVGVYLANSHSWLYSKLTEDPDLVDASARMAETRRDADVVIYLEPPWPDETAPDRLRRLGPRDLVRARVFSQSDQPLVWAPGMYCSLPASRAGSGFTGGFYVAHHHREPGGLAERIESARSLEPDLLWSFMGTYENHPVRRRIGELVDPDGVVCDTRHFSDVVRWNWGSSHRDEGRQAFSDYAALLGRSSFVLCPRGRGASSIRLFEALQAGRCPVVISDDWLPPPLVEWGSCSIRIPEGRVDQIPAILRERASDAVALGQEARRVWEQFFAPSRQLGTIVTACVALETTPLRRAVISGAGVFGPTAARRAYRGLRTAVSG